MVNTNMVVVYYKIDHLSSKCKEEKKRSLVQFWVVFGIFTFLTGEQSILGLRKQM